MQNRHAICCLRSCCEAFTEIPSHRCGAGCARLSQQSLLHARYNEAETGTGQPSTSEGRCGHIGQLLDHVQEQDTSCPQSEQKLRDLQVYSSTDSFVRTACLHTGVVSADLYDVSRWTCAWHSYSAPCGDSLSLSLSLSGDVSYWIFCKFLSALR